MTGATLAGLQAIVQDKTAFVTLTGYYNLCHAFLSLTSKTPFTRIVSPLQSNYVFYQYDETYAYKITRPLNANLFIE